MTLFWRGGEPTVVIVFGQDHHYAFLIGGLVKQAHQRVIIGIDGEHRFSLVVTDTCK